MNRWEHLGAGPLWGSVTTAYFLVALAIHLATWPAFAIRALSPLLAGAVAACLIAAGVIVYLAAFAQLRRALARGQLATTGLYARTRHPLYAAAIGLIVPGVALALRSWLLLPMPLVAYLAARLAVRGEERRLASRFGDAYDRYRQRTNAILPRLRQAPSPPRRRGKADAQPSDDRNAPQEPSDDRNARQAPSGGPSAP
jgi:protein-S-isoprenylcysteine O-methyltransferase Ste14